MQVSSSWPRWMTRTSTRCPSSSSRSARSCRSSRPRRSRERASRAGSTTCSAFTSAAPYHLQKAPTSLQLTRNHFSATFSTTMSPTSPSPSAATPRNSPSPISKTFAPSSRPPTSARPTSTRSFDPTRTASSTASSNGRRRRIRTAAQLTTSAD